MSAPETEHRLRALIANERDDRLAAVTGIVERLGHEVVGSDADVKQVGQQSRTIEADVALVGLGLDSHEALDQMSSIVREAACPVIALLDSADPAYVTEAAKRGVFAYVVIDADAADIQSALDITLHRFAEFQDLQGAFGRRATIEQAKGILMARNGIDADKAFEMLKSHSQRTGQKLIEVATAITQSHALLPPSPQTGPDTRTPSSET
jgi:AmiR/NasT family two-component response regulator